MSTTTSELTQEDAARWFTKNKSWLAGWLTQTKRSTAKRYQVFRRSQNDERDMWPEHELVQHVREEYEPMVLYALVFGANGSFQGATDDIRHSTISGFYEQTGKLPTPKSRVVLHEVEAEPQPFVSSKPTLFVKFEQRFAKLEILRA